MWYFTWFHSSADSTCLKPKLLTGPGEIHREYLAELEKVLATHVYICSSKLGESQYIMNDIYTPFLPIVRAGFVHG